MAAEIQVRKAQFKDADDIAALINRARPEETIEKMDIAERFSQVGFLLAESEGNIVGLIGWQVENLVIRVTDFLVSSQVDRVAAGEAMIEAMEAAGEELQAEASLLFLPPNPSNDLLGYWLQFNYQRQPVEELPKAWREAAKEWNPNANEAMVKTLREDRVMRPM
jgi:N-acetylglutamate synthase-like GNAT family acetyltransferase